MRDEELKASQYRLLELWQQTYQGELLILLPDTFGTTQFLHDAPDWVADGRVSAPIAKILSLQATNTSRGSNSEGAIRGKSYSSLLTPSMSTDTGHCTPILPVRFATAPLPRISLKRATFSMTGEWIPERRIRFSAGWGTLLTNDFRNCNPQGDDSFDPVSLVCKLNDADGRPAVKLSDNVQKRWEGQKRSSVTNGCLGWQALRMHRS